MKKMIMITMMIMMMKIMIMITFMMLKEKPKDVAKLKEFIAKCRNKDGGYGVAPGQPSNISGTYFASIVLYWLK